MKKLFLFIFFVSAMSFAHPVHHHHGHVHHGHVHVGVGVTNPLYYHGGYWGWWWPGYVWAAPYGYSFWGPYWGYAPYYAGFGAIAYSESTDRVGLAWSYATRRLASEAALSYCDVEDCKTVVWVQGGCAALAKSDEGRWGYGYAESKHKAFSYGLRGCKSGGTPGCKIGAWVCSY